MEKLDLILRGQIVLEDEVIYGEVGVKNEKVAIITTDIGKRQAEKVLDFGRSYIFPGLIDTHVHCFSNPNEGFVTTSSSAAVGGITTFFDMPYDLPHPINHVDRFREKVERLQYESVVEFVCGQPFLRRGGQIRFPLWQKPEQLLSKCPLSKRMSIVSREFRIWKS